MWPHVTDLFLTTGSIHGDPLPSLRNGHQCLDRDRTGYKGRCERHLDGSGIILEAHQYPESFPYAKNLGCNFSSRGFYQPVSRASIRPWGSYDLGILIVWVACHVVDGSSLFSLDGSVLDQALLDTTRRACRAVSGILKPDTIMKERPLYSGWCY